MTPQPVTVGPTTPVSEVWRVMLERRFRHMLVTDEQSRLLGIVTQRDLVSAARQSQGSVDLGYDRPISDLVNQEVDTVRPDCCAAEAARHMLRTKRSCLPVVDETGAVVGILTEADYLRLATRDVPPCTCGGVDVGGA